MHRKSISIIAVLCLLTLSSYAFGSWETDFSATWHNGYGDHPATSNTGDWFDPCNWAVWQGQLGYWSVRPPNQWTTAQIEAKQPDPCVTTSSQLYTVYGSAKCARLSIHPWSWAYAPNIRVILIDGDFNCGTQLGLCDWNPFNSETMGAAILEVNGGTIYTGGYPNVLDWNTLSDSNDINENDLDPNNPWWPGRGLWIGGAGDGFGQNWGIVNIRNDAQMIVQRIIINYGDINVLGGMLYQNEANDTYFKISLTRPRNRINITNGELRLKGLRSDTLNYYIGKGRICPCEFHGAFVMDYNATDDYTSLTAICTPDAAWDPKPMDGATRQSLDPTLTWKPGPWAQVDPCDGGTHGVYFGDSEANVRDANDSNTEYKGRQDPCSYAPPHLVADTWYYWRIDEYNNAEHDGNTMWKGNVWKFKTKGPVAGEPNPADKTYGLNIPLQLSWSAGAYTADVNGHILFIGPNETDVKDALYGSWPASVKRYILSSATFPLSNYDYDLVADTNYYWRIDETNDGVNSPPDPNKYWPNDAVWNFVNTNYFVVDNFDICPFTESFADMNNRWKTGYKNNNNAPGRKSYCSNSNFYATHAGLDWESITRAGVSTGVMIFDYDNKTVVNVAYSEARLEVNALPAGGKDWTGGGALPDNDKAKSIAISYLGAPGNDYNPTYDVMYMACEANDGNFGMALQSDAEAQRTNVWDQWEVNFAEVGCPNTKDQNNIDYFYLGFGQRCNKGLVAGAKGGFGTVRFDDLRLYQKHCVPAYAELKGLTADLSDDCKVNIDDIDVLANNWLAKQVVVVPVSAPAAEILWYKFNESTGTDVTDSSGNGYKGKVDSNEGGTTPELAGAQTNQLWDTVGCHDGNCFDMNYLVVNDFNVWIDANKAALQYVADHTTSFSFSVWINGDVYMPLTGWPRLISAFQDFNTANNPDIPGSVDENEVIESWCPAARPNDGSIAYIRVGRGGNGENDNNGVQTPGMPLRNFAGTWQNYIFVRDAAVCPTCPRMRIYHNGEMVAEANKLSGPMFGGPIENFRLGRRDKGSESYLGKIDDFKIYAYALSDAQAGYIGTGGTGYVPFYNVANIKTNPPLTQEFVNFGDFAVLASQWMQGPTLWSP